FEDFLRLNMDIRRLTLSTTGRLVNHGARIRQAKTLAFGASTQQKGTHAARLADTHGADIRLNKLHGVVNRQTGRDRPTWRVDIEVNVLIGVFRFQKQKLSDNHIGHVIFNLAYEKNDALF